MATMGQINGHCVHGVRIDGPIPCVDCGRMDAFLASLDAPAGAEQTYPDNGELECIPWQFCALEDACEPGECDEEYNDPYWMEPEDVVYDPARCIECDAVMHGTYCRDCGARNPVALDGIGADALAQVAMQARTRRAVEIGRALAYRQAGNYVAMRYALDGARHAGMVERAFRAHA